MNKIINQIHKISTFFFLLLCCLSLLFVQCPLLETIAERYAELLDDLSSDTYIRLETRPSTVQLNTLRNLNSNNKYRFYFNYNIADFPFVVGVKLTIVWEEIANTGNDFKFFIPDGFENNLVKKKYIDKIIDLERDSNNKLKGTNYFEWDGSSLIPEGKFNNSIKPICVNIELFTPDEQYANIIDGINCSDKIDILILPNNDRLYENFEFLNPIPLEYDPENTDPDFIIPIYYHANVARILNSSTYYHRTYIKVSMEGRNIPDLEDTYNIYTCYDNGYIEFEKNGTINIPMGNWLEIARNDHSQRYKDSPIKVQFYYADFIKSYYGHHNFVNINNPILIINPKQIEDITNIKFNTIDPNNIQLNELMQGVVFDGTYFLESGDVNDFRGICMVVDEGKVNAVTLWILSGGLTANQLSDYSFQWDGKMTDGNWALQGSHTVKIGFRLSNGVWAGPTYQSKTRSFSVDELSTFLKLNQNASELMNIFDADIENAGSNYRITFDYQYYIQSTDATDTDKLVFQINKVGEPLIVDKIIDNSPIRTALINSETDPNRAALTWDGFIFDGIGNARMAQAGDQIQFKVGFKNNAGNWLSGNEYVQTVISTIKASPMEYELDWKADSKVSDVYSFEDVNSWSETPLEFNFDYKVDKRDAEICGLSFYIGQQNPNLTHCFTSTIYPVQAGDDKTLTIEFDGTWEENPDSTEIPRVTIGNSERPVRYSMFFVDDNGSEISEIEKIEGEIYMFLFDPKEPNIEIGALKLNDPYTSTEKQIVINKSLLGEDYTYYHSFYHQEDVDNNDPNLIVNAHVYMPEEYVDPWYKYEVWFDFMSGEDVIASSNKIILNQYATEYTYNPFTFDYFDAQLVWGGYSDNLTGLLSVQAKLNIFTKVNGTDWKLIVDGNNPFNFGNAQSDITDISFSGLSLSTKNIPIEVDYFVPSDVNKDYNIRNKISLDIMNSAFSVADLEASWLDVGNDVLTFSMGMMGNYGMDSDIILDVGLSDDNKEVSAVGNDALQRLIHDHRNQSYVGAGVPQQVYMLGVGDFDNNKILKALYVDGEYTERGIIYLMDKLQNETTSFISSTALHEIGHAVGFEHANDNGDNSHHSSYDRHCVMTQGDYAVYNTTWPLLPKTLLYEITQNPHFCQKCLKRLLMQDGSTDLNIYTE